MASDTAKAVAHEVIANLSKPQGKRKSKKAILAAHGYKPSIQESPSIVTNTKSYQETIQPFVQRMVIERDRAIGAMARKISKAKYRDLTDSIDKLTKNIQLLTGGSTQNIAIGVKKLTDDELQHLAEGGQS